MDSKGVQKLQVQLGEVRRWFYLNSRDTFGVDITGIILPHEPMTILGGFGHRESAWDSYDYLEPTEFDREQAEAKARQREDEYVEPPRLHHAMARFLHHSVQYLEMRRDLADGNEVQGMATLACNLEQFLKDVEKEAATPPFPEAKKLAADIAHHARVVHELIKGERPLTFELAELQMEQRKAAGR